MTKGRNKEMRKLKKLNFWIIQKLSGRLALASLRLSNQVLEKHVLSATGDIALNNFGKPQRGDQFG